MVSCSLQVPAEEYADRPYNLKYPVLGYVMVMVLVAKKFVFIIGETFVGKLVDVEI